ncbi:MAG: hypothetical protein QF486_06975 [Candidatus Woesearchaeota archaeon]|jgi:hypothetical protein|nr:hypothetical protein [Candidatus Woesearchaeota archaeon]MDP7199326.1 hypothetical protein [Candidatus Woesearchaeota archaeon]MDP7467873.1 hypothetical protein [Candidatus Woesearchaeota archaeon]
MMDERTTQALESIASNLARVTDELATMNETLESIKHNTRHICIQE